MVLHVSLHIVRAPCGTIISYKYTLEMPQFAGHLVENCWWNYGQPIIFHLLQTVLGLSILIVPFVHAPTFVRVQTIRETTKHTLNLHTHIKRQQGSRGWRWIVCDLWPRTWTSWKHLLLSFRAKGFTWVVGVGSFVLYCRMSNTHRNT